jgi:hypothetical protein
MNQALASQIREACYWAKANGHRLLSGGAWFDFTLTPWGCDALGALLLQARARGQYRSLGDLVSPANPTCRGLSTLVRSMLDVDNFWLRRFWLGWDRGYQVKIIRLDDRVDGHKEIESKDDVSAFGIALWKEMQK